MEPRCPELKVIRGGDEEAYLCKLVDKWCLLEHGYECEEYDKIKEELDDGQ